MRLQPHTRAHKCSLSYFIPLERLCLALARTRTMTPYVLRALRRARHQHSTDQPEPAAIPHPHLTCRGDNSACGRFQQQYDS
eukprot:scaffold12151_cov107-Isochrysis_galbana.AAC.2